MIKKVSKTTKIILLIFICAFKKTFPKLSFEGGKQIEATGHLKE